MKLITGYKKIIGSPGAVIRCIIVIILLTLPLAISYQTYDPTIIKSTLFNILLLLAAGVWLIRILLSRELRWVHGPFNLPVAVLSLIYLASYFQSEYARISRPELISSLAPIFFFLLIINWGGGPDFRKTINRILIITVSIVSVYGVLQSLSIDIFPQKDLSRVFATLGHPNFLAGYIALIFPLAAAVMILAKRPVVKFVMIIVMTVMVGGLIATWSRLGFLGFFSGVLTFILIGRVNKLRQGPLKSSVSLSRFYKYGLIVIVLLLVILIIFSFGRLSESNRQRLPLLGSDELTMNTVKIRLLIWEGALKMIKENPLWGMGIGTFSVYFPDYQPILFSWITSERREFAYHAHNEYLELTAETGLLGLGAFGWLLIICFSRARRSFRENTNPTDNLLLNGYLSGLIAFMVISVGSVGMRFAWVRPWFWLMMALIVISTDLRPRREVFRKLIRSGRVIFSGRVVGVILTSVVILYLCIVAFRPYWGDRNFRRAHIYLERKDLVSAEMELKEALTSSPFTPNYHYLLGYVYLSGKKYNKALEEYEKAWQLNPNFSNVNYNLGIVHAELGDLDRSIEYLKRESVINPLFKKTYSALGYVCLERGDKEEAERYRRRFEELRDKNKVKSKK